MRFSKIVVILSLVLLVNNSMCQVLISEIDSVYDIENNIYNTVKIGDQVWLAENLKVTTLNNGIRILNIQDLDSFVSTSLPAYIWYENDKENGLKYGALYNWNVVNTDCICPKGWHVPTNREWNELRNFVGKFEGGKLKDTRSEFWSISQDSATNEYGFSAIPAGVWNENSYSNPSIGNTTIWWSSTEYFEKDKAFTIGLAPYTNYIYNVPLLKYFGLPIRCIKNREISN